MATTDDDMEMMELIRQLFNSAAAMSIAVTNQDDAEPEMARFLHAVMSHPNQRQFVVELFIESFGKKFHLKREPWELLQFCMHALRWPEIRDFIRSKKVEDIEKHGAGSTTVWNDILESFGDNWSGAEQFQEFRQR